MRAPLFPLPLFRAFPSPLTTGFAFFGVATGIFAFMSYVRNVKPEARLVYYLVRRRAARLACCVAPALPSHRSRAPH